MRELREVELDDLSRRRAQFESFLEGRMPVLVDFVERLKLPNAPLVLVEADTFLPAISQYMESQQNVAEDRTWFLTRIGHFIGEWFVQRHGGCWFLNEPPGIRYFFFAMSSASSHASRTRMR